MCGFLGNTTDSPLTQALMESLHLSADALTDNPGSGPASTIDIITNQGIQRAIWWLLLDRQGEQLKPSRYTSFNTRAEKLHQHGSAGYAPYRISRCLIPASYIIEGEGPSKARRYHKIEPTHRAFALGGLYRWWCNRNSGETTLSCSVITLPPHPKWRTIHSKSTPLFLPAENGALISRWLDSDFDEVAAFEELLHRSNFHDPLRCTPIERPGRQEIIGRSFTIED